MPSIVKERKFFMHFTPPWAHSGKRPLQAQGAPPQQVSKVPFRTQVVLTYARNGHVLRYLWKES
jgi:hypothetical protein